MGAQGRDVTGSSPSVWRLAAAPGVSLTTMTLGLACCAVEWDAAVAQGLVRPEEPGDAPAAARVLVVAGTVTTPLAPLLERAVTSDPPPTAVLAFGACASTGGPYWDSPTVINGADQVVDVHEYVPGCPPRPEALVDALLALAGGDS